MSVPLGANGNTFNYPQTNDTGWGDDSTNWASAVSAALGAIGLGATLTPDAVINLASTTKGLLPPVMTTAQRNAISSPTIGLCIINSTTETFDVYRTSGWASTIIASVLTTNRLVNYDGTQLTSSNVTVSGSNISTGGGTITSGAISSTGNISTTGNVSGVDVTGSGTTSGNIVSATTRVTTPEVRASSSAGVTLNANGGTLIGTFGAGGGNNGTFEGGVNIKGAVAVGDGSVSNPGLHFEQDTNNGLYRIGTDEWGVSAGSTQRMRFGSFGVYAPGMVLQVQSVTKTDTFSTTSTSFADITGLSVSITPKSTSSTILLIAHMTSGKSTDNLTQFRFVRDSTAIGIGDAGGGSQNRSTTGQYTGSGAPTLHQVPIIMQFRDSPATTSAITYKVQMLVDSGIGYIGRSGVDTNANGYGRQIATLTAMEIGG